MSLLKASVSGQRLFSASHARLQRRCPGQTPPGPNRPSQTGQERDSPFGRDPGRLGDRQRAEVRSLPGVGTLHRAVPAKRPSGVNGPRTLTRPLTEERRRGKRRGTAEGRGDSLLLCHCVAPRAAVGLLCPVRRGPRVRRDGSLRQVPRPGSAAAMGTKTPVPSDLPASLQNFPRGENHGRKMNVVCAAPTERANTGRYLTRPSLSPSHTVLALRGECPYTCSFTRRLPDPTGAHRLGGYVCVCGHLCVYVCVKVSQKLGLLVPWAGWQVKSCADAV